MENVGQSKLRNKEFREKFSREKLFQHIVTGPTPIIFDIGAHYGESVAFLAPLFPKSTIYSFEPDPISFIELSKSMPQGSACFNLAVSDKEGEVTFYRNKISHTNSLLKVNLESQDSIGIANAIANDDGEYFKDFNEGVRVNSTTLDGFTHKHSIMTIDLLKIDVQGAETHVLSGAKNILMYTRAIVIEIGFFDYYEKQTSFIDVEKFLHPLGFRLYSISEISNNPMNGRTDWAEVVYMNQALINKG